MSDDKTNGVELADVKDAAHAPEESNGVGVSNNNEDSGECSISSSDDTAKFTTGEAKAKGADTVVCISSKGGHAGEFDELANSYRVDWRNLKFSVETKVKKEIEVKEILKGVSGVVKPGRFLAILGASGAGKSSLLNILAGRLRSHDDKKVTGELLANGLSMNQREFEKETAYVMQEETLMETLTPREQFSFAAKLRLPADMPLSEKSERVEHMISTLELDKCADTYVGGPTIQGISGGERKRVSIGVELITNPSIVYLDEPTSGLDSYTAYQTVELLSKLAHSGRTVVATLHQPSSEMFKLFDDLIVLSEGDVVYMGEASEMTTYLSKRGHECPLYTNPADYVIDLVHGRGDVNLATRTEMANAAREDLVVPLEESEVPQSETKSSSADDKSQKVSFFYETYLLMWRSFWDTLRQPLNFRMRLVNQVFFGLLIGVVFFDLSKTVRAVDARLGMIFLALLMLMLDTTIGVMLTFFDAKTIFFRERSNGMYSTFTFLLSKVIVDLPFHMLYVFVMTAIVYPMVGLGSGVDQILKFYLMLLTTVEMSFSIGLVSCCIAPTREVASAISLSVIMPPLIFSGFYVNVEDMPVWISWLTNLSFIKYAMEALVVNEFDANFEVSDCRNRLEGLGCQFTNGQEVLEFWEFDTVNYWEWWAVVVGMTAFAILASYVVLSRRATFMSRRPLQKDDEQPQKDVD